MSSNCGHSTLQPHCRNFNSTYISNKMRILLIIDYYITFPQRIPIYALHGVRQIVDRSFATEERNNIYI